MTAIQRKKHITDIEVTFGLHGYNRNRWNKFQKGEVIVDTRKNNLIVTCGEHKLFSKPMTSLTIEDVKKRIKLLEYYCDGGKAKIKQRNEALWDNFRKENSNNE